MNPIEDRNEVVAPRLSGDHIASRVYSADRELLVERPEVHH
jgi:hypothetical protein